MSLQHPGGRALFTTDKMGRKKQPRGSFFAYIAVSQPPKGAAAAAVDPSAAAAADAAPAAGEGEDVALVWRGTIFREEWESNFAQDELVRGKAENVCGMRQQHQ